MLMNKAGVLVNKAGVLVNKADVIGCVRGKAAIPLNEARQRAERSRSAVGRLSASPAATSRCSSRRLMPGGQTASWLSPCCSLLRVVGCESNLKSGFDLIFQYPAARQATLLNKIWAP